LDGCLQNLNDKNVSYYELKEDCDNLTEDWENVTFELESCTVKSTKLSESLAIETALVSALKGEVSALKKLDEEKTRNYRASLAELLAVMYSVQDDIKCMVGTPNCSFEAGKYWCLPRIYQSSICLIEKQMGQEVFGMSLCPLLGDNTIYNLDWAQFVRRNPRTTTFLLLTLVFATIGLLVALLGCSWGLIWILRRRLLPENIHLEPSSEVSQSLRVCRVIIIIF
jgi:hypothetical protein